MHKVKDCVWVPLKYVREMCFDGVFFRKAQDFSNPYFKDVQNVFSRGQKLSSVRDTSQECCEHPTSHNRPHLIVWYRTPSQTSISRKGMTLTYKIGVIKKGDLVLSMIGSGVLMISSVFCLFSQGLSSFWLHMTSFWVHVLYVAARWLLEAPFQQFIVLETKFLNL